MTPGERRELRELDRVLMALSRLIGWQKRHYGTARRSSLRSYCELLHRWEELSHQATLEEFDKSSFAFSAPRTRQRGSAN